MTARALKGFFLREDARLIDPEEVRERHRVVSSVFYGYPAELVAAWCCVSVETAKRWKAGQSIPPPPALRLFQLHRSGKVLTDSAWDGWIVTDEKLVSPEGREVTQGDLRAQELLYQLLHELGRDSPGFWERLEEIHRAAAG